MQKKQLVLSFIISIIWLGLLAFPLSSSIPIMGPFLHPVAGFWGNAIPHAEVNDGFALPDKFDKNQIDISFNERLVPTINATNDHDLYFMQGYTHAFFRLWQMDMQYRAAGGFLSEVLGAKTINYDRGQRRKGMVYAAQQTLNLILQEPRTKLMIESYTNGVNAFIDNLDAATMPLEYKLMNFKPTPWTPLKTAIIMKLLADDLTGKSDDIAMSLLRTSLADSVINEIFPVRILDAQPVIPNDVVFNQPAIQPASLSIQNPFANLKDSISILDTSITYVHPDEDLGKGSNNWAFSGNVTQSGQPILANDPHLSLNLPSIWFENQLIAAGIHVYGVSIPGAPGVVIGFNEKIAWGFTNNYRDVKDYFDINYNATANSYSFNGKDTAAVLFYDTIRIKGATAYIDTIKYSVHGPIQFEPSFPAYTTSNNYLAQSWEALQPSNELLALYIMNRSQDIAGFEKGIQYFSCPAQNFAYIDQGNNIAIWGQGAFRNKWPNQGRFVMRGDTVATTWGAYIPFTDVPKVINPKNNYVGSANQQVTGANYPYWMSGNFSEFRSWDLHYLIKQKLADSNARHPNVDVSFSKDLQLSNFSILAYLLKDSLLVTASKYGDTTIVQQLQNWDCNLDAQIEIASLFQIWFQLLHQNVWKAYLPKTSIALLPKQEITMQLVLGKINQMYWDKKETAEIEHFEYWSDVSFTKAVDSLQQLKAKYGNTNWFQIKKTTIQHLTKLPAFGYYNIENGGWGNTLNAVKNDHGPSWRMIVTFENNKPVAEVVYPGGQSGNPGSKNYNAFVDAWTKGEYYHVTWKP